jgi:hypothetical protein
MKTRVAALAAFLVTSGCGAAEPPAQQQQRSATAEVAMQYLDSAHPSIVQPIDTAAIAAARFVRVEVAKVDNPRKYALSFNVDFRDSDGNSVRLGTFSLFPADNPGTFIVPVQHQLRTGGSIVVSLVIVDTPAPDAQVRAGIGRIELVLGG